MNHWSTTVTWWLAHRGGYSWINAYVVCCNTNLLIRQYNRNMTVIWNKSADYDTDSHLICITRSSCNHRCRKYKRITINIHETSRWKYKGNTLPDHLYAKSANAQRLDGAQSSGSKLPHSQITWRLTSARNNRRNACHTSIKTKHIKVYHLSTYRYFRNYLNIY